MTTITGTKRDGKPVAAYFVKGKKVGIDGKKDGFKCFPSSCNDAEKARNFDTIREAAEFLTINPSWGIRMNPGGGIFANIVIDGRTR
jgi:hypothetical protein